MRMFSDCSKIVSDLFLRKIFILKGSLVTLEMMRAHNALLFCYNTLYNSEIVYAKYVCQ